MIYRHILSYLQLLVARFSGFSCNDVIRFGIVQPSYNTVLLRMFYCHFPTTRFKSKCFGYYCEQCSHLCWADCILMLLYRMPDCIRAVHSLKCKLLYHVAESLCTYSYCCYTNSTKMQFQLCILETLCMHAA